MKAVYAGVNTPLTNIRNYLQACTGRANDFAYLIPAGDLSDVQLYVELPGKPTAQTLWLYNLCDESQVQVTPDQYIIGIDPAGAWYGVFTFPAAFPVPARFAIAFEFMIEGAGHIYFSQAYTTQDCSGLMRIEACFPVRRTDEFGYDLNGLYFGTTIDMAASLGVVNLTYKHVVLVRRGKVFKEAPKFTFTSNVRRNFRTKVEKPFELRTEIVPDWYKDYLLAVYSRGFIAVQNTIYRVTDLAFEGVNEDDRTWLPYAKLLHEKDLHFGCEDCTPAPIVLPCVTTLAPGEWSYEEGYFYLPFTGTATPGSILEWQIIQDGQTVVQGSRTEAPYYIQTLDIAPAEECYTVRWRVTCPNSQSTEFVEFIIGNCLSSPRQISGTLSMASYGNQNQNAGGEHCKASGFTRFRFRFSEPLAEPLVIRIAALYYADNGSNIYTSIGNSIVPPNHAQKPYFNQTIYDTPQQAPFEVTIPAGSTDFWTGLVVNENNRYLISYPTCNQTWGANARHKILYEVVSPAGKVVNLTAAYDTASPFNTVVGGIITLEQI